MDSLLITVQHSGWLATGLSLSQFAVDIVTQQYTHTEPASTLRKFVNVEMADFHCFLSYGVSHMKSEM